MFYGKSIVFSGVLVVLCTVNLSRFPWSGGPTINLSRFPWSGGLAVNFGGLR